MDEAAGLDVGEPRAPAHGGNDHVNTIPVDAFRRRDERYHNDNCRGVSTGLHVCGDLSNSACKYQANPAFAREKSLSDFIEGPGPGPRQTKVDRPGGVFETGKVARKEERLAVIRPKRFIDAVAEEQAVVEDRNLGLFRARYGAVDVDT